MEDQCSPLSWTCYYQEEGIEELKHSLLYTSMELETTILYANEEIARKDDELVHLKGLLSNTIKERDEARAKCHSLMYDNLVLLQQQLLDNNNNNNSLPTGGGDSNTGFSSSGCSDIIIIASPPSITEEIPPPPPLLPNSPSPPPPPPPPPLEVADNKSILLPEKGKFLQAVMEAGPLLKTLLIAGPLPQWRHPPPKLDATEIPPVTIPPPTTPHLRQYENSCVSTTSTSSFTKKRDLVEYSDHSPMRKLKKSCSPVIINKHLAI